MILIDNILALGVPRDTAERAAHNLQNRVAGWVVVSGKMGSGKDTVAPLVLPGLGHTDVARVGYSDPMKTEYQYLLDLIWGAATDLASARLLARTVEKTLGYRFDDALEAVSDVQQVLAGGKPVLASDRTNQNRVVLQKVGGHWRTWSDEAYWSKMVSILCLEKIAEGTSVYLTGGRFLPDVEIPQAMGATIIRLDVTREVQLQRLQGRDGGLPTEAELNHPGELALDDWDGFDIRIDNNGTLEEAMENILARMNGVLA